MSSSTGPEARGDGRHRRLSDWRGRIAAHGKNLGQLWGSSAFSAGVNALALALVVSRAPESTFAAYAAAQAVTLLASTWADGGLGGALQLLASQEGSVRGRWDAYRAAGLSLSWRILAVMTLPLAALVVALHGYSKVLNSASLAMLALFGVTGLFQARGGIAGALLYALGRFGTVTRLQVIGAGLRAALLAGVVGLEGRGTGLTSLLACELLSSAVGWGLAGYCLRKHRQELSADPEATTVDTAGIRRELYAFMRPTVGSVLISSLSFSAGMLAGSFFGGAPTVAVYALFMRLNQMASVAIGPLVGYAGRRLRLVANAARASKIRHFLIALASGLSIAAGMAMILYLLAGRWVHHYAFGYPGAFALFLCASALGICCPILDYLIACWGEAGHRPFTSWLGLGKVVLLLGIRPGTAEGLFGVDLLTNFAVDAWLLFRLRKIHRRIDVTAGLSLEERAPSPVPIPGPALSRPGHPNGRDS